MLDGYCHFRIILWHQTRATITSVSLQHMPRYAASAEVSDSISMPIAMGPPFLRQSPTSWASARAPMDLVGIDAITEQVHAGPMLQTIDSTSSAMAVSAAGRKRRFIGTQPPLCKRPTLFAIPRGLDAAHQSTAPHSSLFVVFPQSGEVLSVLFKMRRQGEEHPKCGDMNDGSKGFEAVLIVGSCEPFYHTWPTKGARCRLRSPFSDEFDHSVGSFGRFCMQGTI